MIYLSCRRMKTACEETIEPIRADTRICPNVATGTCRNPDYKGSIGAIGKRALGRLNLLSLASHRHSQARAAFSQRRASCVQKDAVNLRSTLAAIAQRERAPCRDAPKRVRAIFSDGPRRHAMNRTTRLCVTTIAFVCLVAGVIDDPGGLAKRIGVQPVSGAVAQTLDQLSANDISWLFPPPATDADLADQISMRDLVGLDGPVWSDHAFNQFLTIATGPAGSVPSTMQ